MQDKYLIFMDVSGDISPEYAKKHDIKFLPMDYSIGNEMRTCEEMEDPFILKKFYDGQRNGDFTKTTQISPYMYEELMEPYFEQGYSAIYICLSGGLSSTFNSACTAQEALKDRYPEQDFLPIDSLAATGGMGVLAERAVRNRESGLDIKLNYQDIKMATKRIKHWFMVQDLMYLKRGGRVSAATAAVGTVLNVRPILKIDNEGKLINIDKKRGNRSAVKNLIDRFKETYDPTMGDVIYVIDADADELAAYAETEIKNLYPDACIRRSMLSPIIGAHTGPGMIAICHMGN